MADRRIYAGYYRRYNSKVIYVVTMAKDADTDEEVVIWTPNVYSDKAGGYIGYIATRDGVEKLPRPEGYVECIAMRPGAERHDGHGLFSSQPVDLDAVMKEAEQHDGPVWALIYSLKRDDAARLGYDNAKGWQTLLKAHQVELATAMKIPPEQFRWYAAYHDEGEHPHIHMTVWADDPKQGFLTKEGIKTMRSVLTNSIF